MTKIPKEVAVKKSQIEKHVSATEIESGVSTLLSVIEERNKTAKKNELFKGDSEPIYMQIVPFKVPITPNVTLRVALTNSLSVDKDACLIVKNIKTGKKNDNERTINHYQNLLKDIDIKGSIQVIPIAKFCDEHQQYEEKSKFAHLYDTYLVDGRLLPVAARTCGIRFSKAGKHLIPVGMDTLGLKKRLEHALTKTAMNVHSKGDTYTMRVAYSTMTPKQISENVLSAITGICQQGMFPGGIENIRTAHVKTARSLAIPVFISRNKHNNVAKPTRKMRLPKAYKVEEGELTTVMGGIVQVNPEGDVHFRQVITREDRRIMANADSDDAADDTKEEMPSDSESIEEEEVKKGKAKTKSAKKRKLPVGEESDDDEDVEAAEEDYMKEIEGGSGGDDSNEGKESTENAPAAKAKKGKKSPKPKNKKNKKK